MSSSPTISQVVVPPRDVAQLEAVLGRQAIDEARSASRAIGALIGGGAIWNVNSTAVGGGVAEMLQPLIGYSLGLGLDVRWAVIGGRPDFFFVTKRLHHALHGARGAGTPLGDAEHAIYEEVLAESTRALLARLSSRDVVILHDPQTAGMAPALLDAGHAVIWRCHIGYDRTNDDTELGWRFLEPYLARVQRLVFSRRAYVPPGVVASRVTIIPPSIDAFSAKNQPLEPDVVRSILAHVGLVEGPLPEPPRLDFVRADGSTGAVERQADVVRLGRAPTWDQPLVVQISRWDPLKDMLGVLHGFTRLDLEATDAALVLAGPNVKGVADDPEGPAVYDEVLEAWRALPHETRQRVHLICLPTADVDENAVIVNALQRHASIVVQKSLREGFGLTVTEAMWKGRPVVATRVGGIQDQIVDGECGVLLDDPADLDAFSAALARLLHDPALARRLGDAAHERVRAHFLGIRHLLQYGDLLGLLL